MLAADLVELVGEHWARKEKISAALAASELPISLDRTIGSLSGGEVLAAGAGTVYFVGQVAGKPVVSISHADGVRTTYQPVFAHVTKGQILFEGEDITHYNNKQFEALRGNKIGLVPQDPMP